MVNNMADSANKTKKFKKKPEEYQLATFGKPADGISEVLQTAYMNSTLNDGKRRNKNKDLLENLKNGGALQKDGDDVTLLANIYNPDADPKNAKSNKQRQKKTTDVDNDAFADNEYDVKTPKEKIKKKKKDNVLIEKIEVPEAAEAQHRAQLLDDPIPPPRKTKRKKKKTSSRTTDDETSEHQGLSDGNESKEEAKEEVAKMEIVNETKLEKRTTETKTKRTKKTKKKRGDDVAAYAASLNDAEGAAAAAAAQVEDNQVLQVIVHRTDKLKSDFYISHPLVRIHVIDIDTGNYLKKRDRNRPVSSRHETENERVDYILPIMTLPFDFKKNHSTLPVWEDHIIFNESFRCFVECERKVMLIFELLDFVSMNTTNRPNNEAQSGGWHHIAWSFLKLVGSQGQQNIGKKVRLQLYLPPTRYFSKEGHVEVFNWWNSHQRVAYPSTLYVTVKPVVINRNIEPSTRSMFAVQEERGRTAYDEMQTAVSRGLGQESCLDGQPCTQASPWLRFAGQQCKIPNALMCNLSAGRKGCFVVKFSHSGRSLACGCHERDSYPILIFEIPSGRLRSELVGHCGIIYDISWSPDDLQLLSASGDGTARIWDVAQSSDTLKKMLPHPSFVYCAKYHPQVNKIVVTGCYDRLIRIWSLQTDELQALLLQELDGHLSFVNTLCFDEDGVQLFSGDSLGCIFVWNVFVTEKPSSKGLLKEWSKKKELAVPDIKGSPINLLALHPNGRRLLVHSRNNKLYLIDLRIESIMHKFIGALNFREHIRSTVTPCGTFVFAGSEDGQVYVWNTDTGDQVVVYSDLGYRTSVCDVDFHPTYNIVAFCSHGDSQPVKLYKYDPDAAQKNVIFELAGPFHTLRPDDEMCLELPTARTQEQDLYRPDSSFMGATSDFNISQKARYERVMQKLQCIGQMERPSASTSFEPDFSTRNVSLLTGESDWKPEFTQISGRTGSMRSSARGPCAPQFAFNNAEGKSKIIFTGNSGLRQEVVVALYDYLAQRSDELTLIRGDRVRVLYKDSENWWMGELEDGQQGFFPANYVVSGSPTKSEKEQKEKERAETEDESPWKPCSTPFDSDADSSPYRKTTHAVVDKSGGLRYISATEDSDAESSTNRTKKKRARKPPGSVRIVTEAQINKPPRSGRSTPRKKTSSFAPT